MKARVLLALLLVPAVSPAQTWEKLVMPGLTYRMETEFDPPRVIHAYRFSPSAVGLGSRTEVAGQKVFESGSDLDGRLPVSKVAIETGALAAVNGDFFPWNGDPLGAMVRESELVSAPFEGRSSFGWGVGGGSVARLKWEASAIAPGGKRLALTGLNEVCKDGMAVLNSATGGTARAETASTFVVLEFDGKLSPTFNRKLKVVTSLSGLTSLPIGPDQMVLVGNGEAAKGLDALAAGAEVGINLSVTGFDWNKIQNVIGGGPVVVDGGTAVQSWDAEDFKPDFSTKRHPRTAMGATTRGDIWLVVIDGRQPQSVGATLDELAAVMRRLGCQQAINLDGGGSSTLTLGGLVLNKPSDEAERPVANTVLLFGDLPQGQAQFVIKGSPEVAVGSGADYQVFDDKGNPVPNSRVVWATEGTAWIDQGGRLRPLAAGEATVRAWIDGTQTSVKVTLAAQKKKS